MKLATDVTHCDDLMKALEGFRGYAAPVVRRWGTLLASRLGAGSRLLVAGNGGSAAQAQHLTAELVGRYRDDRPPFSALALHADTSSTTAIANDYGVQEIFARQVAAHGRAGDVLMLLSTSGASGNLLVAASEARRLGMTVWALTGPAPNPLAGGADEALCVEAATAATVQELHLVAVHMLCEAFDQAVERREAAQRRRLAGERGETAEDRYWAVGTGAAPEERHRPDGRRETAESRRYWAVGSGPALEERHRSDGRREAADSRRPGERWALLLEEDGT